MSTPAPILAGVSVVIPAFNCAPFIGATLDSVFAQTHQPTEIIVVDDGSTDNLDAALHPYLDRIKLVRQKNSGSAAARNTGILHARCSLIQFVDGDDVLMPDAVEDQVRCLLESRADVVYGDCVFWGSNYDGKRFTELYPSTGRVTVDSVLARRCNVVYAVLSRREALLESGLFDIHMRLCEDMDLWVRMLKSGFRFAYHNKVLLRYRRQGQNKTSHHLKNILWEVVMYSRFLCFCLNPVGIVLHRICRLSSSCFAVAAAHLVPRWSRVAVKRIIRFKSAVAVPGARRPA